MFKKKPAAHLGFFNHNHHKMKINNTAGGTVKIAKVVSCLKESRQVDIILGNMEKRWAD